MEKEIFRIAAIFSTMESPEENLVVINRKKIENMEPDPCDTSCNKTDYISHFLKLSISRL